MIDTDPRDLIERMCACLHGWSVLWGPAANSPTRLLVDEARRYLAQPEFKPPSLKEQAQQSLLRLASHSNSLMSEDAADADTIRKALEALADD